MVSVDSLAYRYKQEVSLKKIIFEGYRAVGSLNDSFQSSNFVVVVVLH